MTIYQDLLGCEDNLDQFEKQLETGGRSHYRPLDLPTRSDGVPPDLLTIGLVGGTGVGKSTLVNALAGRNVSAASSRRPTTSRIIPYVHKNKIGALEHLRFLSGHLSETIASHEIDALESLIIFDLPDIDSTSAEHADVVSAALSGLDLVVWVTSLTKYSDREFHQWIERHAGPRNLDNAIFLLNKVDSIQETDRNSAAVHLAKNFKDAITDTLGANASPIGEARFYTCSALRPHDSIPGNQFAQFASELARERSQQEIQRIKSSDRIALLTKRLAHIARSVEFTKRQEKLKAEIEVVRTRVEKLIHRDDIKTEVRKRLEASSAPEKAGARLFEQSLADWPLLPHLRILALPLRQAGRLLGGAKLLIPDDEKSTRNRPFPQLTDGMFAIEKERRRAASRSSKPLLRRDREAEHEAISQRLSELENECVLRVREGLSEIMDPASDIERKPNLVRRLLVWSPLLWFPLLQPLLEEILNPTANTVNLWHRLTYRLVRMFGATHLLVSAAFVLIIYLVYILVIRARSHVKAVAQCRKLLVSDWWREALLERLTEHLTTAESSELARLEDEEAEFKTLSARVKKLEEVMMKKTVT